MLKPRLAISTNVLDTGNRDHWLAQFLDLKGHSYEGIGVDLTGTSSVAQATGYADPLSQATKAGLSVAWLQGELPADSNSEDKVKALCELGQAMETVNICLVESPFPGGTERDRIAWSAARWKGAAQVAAEHGQRVLWAFGQHDVESSPSTGVIEAVLRKVDQPNFGLVFDTKFMQRLAFSERHELIDEGRPIRGALGLVERYKGWIGSIRLNGYSDQPTPVIPDQAPPLDWDRMIPALADAWVPDPWWTLVTPSMANAGPLAQSLRDLLAPFSTGRSAF